MKSASYPGAVLGSILSAALNFTVVLTKTSHRICSAPDIVETRKLFTLLVEAFLFRLNYVDPPHVLSIADMATEDWDFSRLQPACAEFNSRSSLQPHKELSLGLGTMWKGYIVKVDHEHPLRWAKYVGHGYQTWTDDITRARIYKRKGDAQKRANRYSGSTIIEVDCEVNNA